MIKNTLLLLALITISVSVRAEDDSAYGRGHKPNTHKAEQEIEKNWKKYSADSELARLALPTSVDNSQLPAFPPIASQGTQNSCVSWAITYYQLTHNVGLQKGWDNKNTLASTKFSPKWTYNMVNSGLDSGSSSAQTLKVLQYHGALTLEQRPYDMEFKSWPESSDLWKAALSYRIEAPQVVSSLSTSTGMTNAKTLLSNGYVLTFSTYIDSLQYKKISDNQASTNDDLEVGKNVGYYLNGSVGGHMMTIVGYNDDVWTDINSNGTLDSGELGAFRIANSWGSNWHDKGFTWIAYDAFKATSAVTGAPTSGRIALAQSDRAYHIVPRLNYQPKLLAEVDLGHLYRNQITVNLGSSTISNTSPTTTLPLGILQAQGGALAFDGGTSKLNRRFVFDLTDLVPATSEDKKYYVSLTDTDTGTALDVTDFVLVDVDHLSRSASADGSPTSFSSTTKHLGINWNASTGASPVIDTTAPQVSVSISTSFTYKIFSAQTSDSSGISKVDFFVDGSLKGSDSTAPYSYSLLLKKLTPGLHTVEVVSTDMAGNRGTTGRISFNK